MKVVVFSHFFEIVEKHFICKKVVKQLLKTSSCLYSEVVYSLVSANSLTGIVSLCFSIKSSTVSVSNYLRTFDKSLFHTFTKTYYDYINNNTELPHFTASRTDNSLMNHLSFQKAMSNAHGLTEYFTGYTIKNASIKQKSQKGNGGLVKFVLTRQ